MLLLHSIRECTYSIIVSRYRLRSVTHGIPQMTKFTSTVLTFLSLTETSLTGACHSLQKEK